MYDSGFKKGFGLSKLLTNLPMFRVADMRQFRGLSMVRNPVEL